MLLQDTTGCTPVHFAAAFGHLDQVPKCLLTLETMLIKDNMGKTPLHNAAKHYHLDQLLGIDFSVYSEAKKIVGKEWWNKNLEVLRQKQEVVLLYEPPEVDLF